jgi:phosphatidylglycerophosphatase A
LEPPRPSLAAIGVATVFGAGFSPVAPGTFGSVAGVALSMATLSWPLYAKLAVLVAVSLAGWWAAERIGRAWGHDHQRVVIDEVAGQYLTLLLTAGSHVSLLIGFVLFRFFDITKPQPARYFDNQKSGWYTMADDLAAGLYGLAALTLVEYFL